jgi:molybdate transport system ATP-binding protein
MQIFMVAVDITCRRNHFTLSAKFTVEQPGITAVCGPSGAGKTTLLRAIAGLETETQGSILVGAMNWVNMPIHRRSVGYVFQDARLFPHLSVAENLRYAIARVKTGTRHYGLPEVVEWLGLDELLGRFPHQLSGGQQRRAAVARALLAYPEIVLFDEPLNGLDTESAASIMHYIHHAVSHSFVPALYATHTHTELITLANRMVYLNKGKICFNGKLEQAMLDPSLPYVHRADGCNVLFGTVSKHNHQLTEIQTAFGSMIVPGVQKTLGEAVRILIPMNAISLSNQKPPVSSISNVFHLPIQGIDAPRNDKVSGVQTVLLGSVPTIAARITSHSAMKMEIKVGCYVYAQIKAVAITII